MNRLLLVKARRSVPSGRGAQSARVLPVRACFAHGYRHRLPVRGSAWPGQDARHCSPPTVLAKRIRDRMRNDAIGEATTGPTILRPQAMFLGQPTKLYPRNDCAKFAQNSRNGHKLAGHRFSTSASASIPHTVPVRVLSVAFPRTHTFSVHVQSVAAIRPHPIRRVSNKCLRSVHWFSHLPRKGCLVGLSNRELPNDSSAVARNRVGWALDSWSSPAACQSLWIFRTFLLAFRVVLLASSGGRLKVTRSSSCPASLAESVGFCPLAPDRRIAIDRPGNGPRSIAVRSAAVRLNTRRRSSLCVLCFNSASGAAPGKSKGMPNQKQ